MPLTGTNAVDQRPTATRCCNLSAKYKWIAHIIGIILYNKRVVVFVAADLWRPIVSRHPENPLPAHYHPIPAIPICLIYRRIVYELQRTD